MTATTLELQIANAIMNVESTGLGDWLRNEEEQLQDRTAEVERAWFAAGWDGTTPPLPKGASCFGSSLTEYAAAVSIALEFGTGANGVSEVTRNRATVTQAFCAGLEPEAMAQIANDAVAVQG